MASLTEEPWFIGIVAGLAALILVLICIIVIFCTLWARYLNLFDVLLVLGRLIKQPQRRKGQERENSAYLMHI